MKITVIKRESDEGSQGPFSVCICGDSKGSRQADEERLSQLQPPLS